MNEVDSGIKRRFRKPKHTRGLIKKDSSKEFFFLSFFEKFINLWTWAKFTLQTFQCSVDEQVKKQTNKTNKEKNKQQTKKGTKQKKNKTKKTLS